MIKTIQMTIDDTLLGQVDEVVTEIGSNRSAFIREALEQALKQWHIRRMEKSHAHGYAKMPTPSDEFDIWFEEQSWAMNDTRPSALVYI